MHNIIKSLDIDVYKKVISINHFRFEDIFS